MSEENYNSDMFQEGQNSANPAGSQENPGQGSGFGNDHGQENSTQGSYGQNIYREGSASYSGSYQENQDGYSYQSGYQYQNYDEPPKESMGFGIASMVLGIIALVLFCSCFNILLAVLSIIFGIIHLVRCRGGKGFAIAGIIMSVLSVIAFFVMWVSAFNSPVFQEEFQEEFQRQFRRQLEEQGELYDDFNFPFDNYNIPFDDYDEDEDSDDRYEYHDEDDDHHNTF